MGQHVSRNDFEWVYTQEPHRTRRKEILEKHPEVRQLMGPDPNLKYAVFAMVLVQTIAAYLMKDASWFTIIVVGYCFGGVINHSMTLAIHEISHNLAFGHSRPFANRILGMIGNFPLGIPYSVSFKKYHIEHHRYQGDEDRDVDIPTKIEGRLFCTKWSKVLWLLLQPFFYAIRPLFVRPKAVGGLEVLNLFTQVIFDIFVLSVMGPRSLAYLIIGTLLAMGIHPVAGHFISEHYMFKKGYETYSYYGPLNAITFNVGYHNEHHDFPSIPGSRLPQLKKLAPEYYDNIPSHTSWVKVLWDFVMDPEIGPYARIKRRRIPFPGEKEEDLDKILMAEQMKDESSKSDETSNGKLHSN